MKVGSKEKLQGPQEKEKKKIEKRNIRNITPITSKNSLKTKGLKLTDIQKKQLINIIIEI